MGFRFAAASEPATVVRPQRLASNYCADLCSELISSLGTAAGTGPELDRRRRIVALALTASGSMGLISLYQMGILRHLPEPPLPGLDADRVDASEEAYEKLQSPDAVLGLTSYAVTAWLAAAGEPDRARLRPWLPLALAGKVGLDAAQAAKLSWDQWARHRAFCSWCLLAAGATFAMVPLVIPEARQALDHLHNGHTAPSRLFKCLTNDG